MDKAKVADLEKEGLKIDKERVLTYSKLDCPFNCKYCFMNDINSEQRKNVAYLSEKQFDLLKQLPEEISLIMLGCDTEFFHSTEVIDVIKKVSELNKDVSVITRCHLSQKYIKEIKQINDRITQNGNVFTFSISIPCLDSVKEWEPVSPDPYKRINTLKDLHEAGIKTLVAIRPLLPTISDQELRKIVELTKDYCEGYYSGPLYLKNLDTMSWDKETIQKLDIEELQPHWMPEGNIFYKVERPGQIDILNDILKEHNKLLFEGAAEAVQYLKIKKAIR